MIARLSKRAVVAQVCTPTSNGQGSESNVMSAILIWSDVFAPRNHANSVALSLSTQKVSGAV